MNKFSDLNNVSLTELKRGIYTFFHDLEQADWDSLYSRGLELINAKLTEFGMSPGK